jgi:hypothetical protein
LLHRPRAGALQERKKFQLHGKLTVRPDRLWTASKKVLSTKLASLKVIEYK